MKRLIYLSLVITFCFISCSETSKNEEIKATQAIKKAQIKTMKVVEYTYKFGSPDLTTGITLQTSEYNKEGNVVKETFPSKILTYAYKDVAKSKKTSDIQELNSDFILQYQTNFEYTEDKTITSIRYTVDGDMISKSVIKRDEYDRDTTILIYNKQGSIVGKSITKYDDIGLADITIYGGQDNIQEKTVRITGDKNKRVYVRYNENGVVVDTFTEYYDKEDRLIEFVNNADNASLYRHFKRSYKDNLLDEQVEFFRNGEPKSQIKYTYEK